MGLVDLSLDACGLLGIVGLLFGTGKLLLELGDFFANYFDSFFCLLVHRPSPLSRAHPTFNEKFLGPRLGR